MISHAAVFTSAVSLFLGSLATLAIVAVHRRPLRALPGEGEPEEDFAILLSRLNRVDTRKVALVAADLDETAQDHAGLSLESWQIWELLGGLEGVEALAANCEVLIDLAFYVQRWYPEALPVAEQLRLHAREVQWHLERLKGAEMRGHLATAFPDYAQRAAAIYYGMTQHVLALYQASQVPGWTTLEAAL